jgi:cytochrome b involved in lipid metabolism
MTSTKSRIRILTTVVSIAAAGTLIAPGAAHAETVYTFSEVQKHATAQDCWSIVNGGVYNLTNFIPRHEGGPTVIIAMCGIDGTASYNGRHGGNQGGENEPARALAHYRIGVLDPNSLPTSTTPYTAADVAAHNTATDCWSIVDGKVYNLTNWVGKHPGGPGVITSMCGTDGTSLFNSKHQGSATAAGALAGYVIGSLSGPSSTASTPTSTPKTKKYTMKQVKKHATASNCWTVVNKGVYNVTAWIPKHPGGSAVVVSMCGKKGTAMYKSQHAGDAAAAGVLKGYRIGRIA